MQKQKMQNLGYKIKINPQKTKLKIITKPI